MKKTQFIEVCKNFKKQFVTFISIVLFVAFGIGAFLGLSWSGEAVVKTTDNYFNEGKFQDISISYPWGFTDDDVLFLKERIRDFSIVEPRYTSFEFIERGDEKFQVKAISLTNKINTLTSVDGRLPKEENEIALEEQFAKKNGYKIGDKLSFNENEISENALGMVKNALLYPDDIVNYLRELETNRNRTNSLDFTVTAIVKSSEYLSSFVNSYGVNTSTGCAVNGIVYLNKSAFNANVFPGYSNVLVKCRSLANYDSFTDEYIDGLNNTINKNKEVISAHFEEEYDELYSMFQSVYDDLINNYGEYFDILNEVKETIDNSLLSSNIFKIGYNGKDGNNAYVSIKTIKEVFDKLKYTLCSLFVIVGTLVSYFAVSRNVFDQTKLLGTKKALGFTKKEILFSLLLFSFLSTLTGIIVGGIASRFGIEPVLLKAMQGSYSFNNSIFVFKPWDLVIFSIIEFVLILGATFFASRTLLKKSAYTLLNDSDESVFKKRWYMKTKAYKKSSLMNKTIVNNLTGNKRRTLATIVGIMGIASLLISSISLNNFIQGSFTRQNSEVTSFNTVIYEDGEKDIDNKIVSYLEDEGLPNSEIMLTYIILHTPDDKTIASLTYVVDDSESFLNLFALTDGKNTVSEVKGFYSSISYKNYYKDDADKQLNFDDLYGGNHKYHVTQYFNYYLLQNVFVIDSETYETEFNSKYTPNAILVNRGDISVQTINSNLRNVDGYINTFNAYEENKRSFDSFASVFAIVVALYAFLAVFMALIVINNLLSMFIKERQKELIVLMINGFTKRQTMRYIYIDTIILTIIGTILGVALGVGIGNLSLTSYLSGTVYMVGGINWPAIIIGVSATIVLTFIVTIYNLRKIKKLKLSDINK